MVFVDAQRYLKVQDEDLDESFNAAVTGDGEDKYSKASFESFELEPTRFHQPREWRRYLIPGTIVGILVVSISLLVYLLVIVKGTDGVELGMDEDGNPYTTD